MGERSSVMTTLPEGGPAQDSGILRTAAQHSQVNIGVYASVSRSGRSSHGNPVGLE
jgi:hypothetical protein